MSDNLKTDTVVTSWLYTVSTKKLTLDNIR